MKREAVLTRVYKNGKITVGVGEIPFSKRMREYCNKTGVIRRRRDDHKSFIIAFGTHYYSNGSIDYYNHSEIPFSCLEYIDNQLTFDF